MRSNHHTTAKAMVALVVLLLGTASASFSAFSPSFQGGVPSSEQERRVAAIREALLRLPYYSVFDFLAFSYEKGTVTLGGYGYHGTLKSDAERAVKRVSGVDQVVNKIAILPASFSDDDLRWRTYYAIYTNDFLAKYAPGGGVFWGHRHAMRGGMFGSFATLPGEEPLGTFPIHIVVEGGRIRLLGIVDNETDKTVANLAARGVSGSFGVTNDLVVETTK